MARISVVIPVYNEAPGIPALVSRLLKLSSACGQDGWEFILVDDHSTDRTQSLLREACRAHPELRYLRLSSNCGSHVAILAGLEHARGDCAVFLAADLQDPPELVPEMLRLWRGGHHVVWAVREAREGISWVERSLSRLFYWLLIRIGMVKLPPQGSDFALLDRNVIEALLRSAGSNPSIGGAIAQLGFSQAQIPYRKAPREVGVSKWTLEKKLRAFADAFVSFTYVPLRFMSYLGILCSMAGFLYAALVIGIRLVSDRPVEGWASLMVAVLVLGGIQMTMIGVLGEYLWRTLEAARRRPRYFAEDYMNFEDEMDRQGREMRVAGDAAHHASRPGS